MIKDPQQLQIDVEGQLPAEIVAVLLEDLSLDGCEFLWGKFFELFVTETEVEEEFFFALEAKFLEFCVVDGWTIHTLVLTAVLLDSLLQT